MTSFDHLRAEIFFQTQIFELVSVILVFLFVWPIVSLWQVWTKSRKNLCLKKFQIHSVQFFFKFSSFQSIILIFTAYGCPSGRSYLYPGTSLPLSCIQNGSPCPGGSYTCLKSLRFPGYQCCSTFSSSAAAAQDQASTHQTQMPELQMIIEDLRPPQQPQLPPHLPQQPPQGTYFISSIFHHQLWDKIKVAVVENFFCIFWRNL